MSGGQQAAAGTMTFSHQVFLTAFVCTGQSTSPVDAQASVQFNTNGTVTLDGNTGTAGTGWDSGGGATAYWLRYTHSTGTAPNDGGLSAGTWYALSSARKLGQLTNSPGSLTSTGTVEISTNSSGTLIVATTTIGLGATRI
jgi:hypothetical protein